jgi:hypothetical protein
MELGVAGRDDTVEAVRGVVVLLDSDRNAALLYDQKSLLRMPSALFRAVCMSVCWLERFSAVFASLTPKNVRLMNPL